MNMWERRGKSNNLPKKLSVQRQRLVHLKENSKFLYQPGPGQGEVRSLEVNPGLPRGWQGPKYLSHQLLPLLEPISKKPEMECSTSARMQASQGVCLLNTGYTDFQFIC